MAHFYHEDRQKSLLNVTDESVVSYAKTEQTLKLALQRFRQGRRVRMSGDTVSKEAKNAKSDRLVEPKEGGFCPV